MDTNALGRALHAAVDAFIRELEAETARAPASSGPKKPTKRRPRMSPVLPPSRPLAFTDEVSRARAITALQRAGLEVPASVRNAPLRTELNPQDR